MELNDCSKKLVKSMYIQLNNCLIRVAHLILMMMTWYQCWHFEQKLVSNTYKAHLSYGGCSPLPFDERGA